MTTKFCAEHINDANKYNKKSFRTKISGEHRILLGCPKGKYDIKTKTCRVAMQVVKILHPEGESKCLIGGKDVKKKNEVKAPQFLGRKPYRKVLYKIVEGYVNAWKEAVKIEKTSGKLASVVNLTKKAPWMYGVYVQIKEIKKKNPGATWHRKKANDASDDKMVELKKSGKTNTKQYGFFDGIEYAHHESMIEATKLHMNPINKRTLKAEASRLWLSGYSMRQIIDYFMYKYKLSKKEVNFIIKQIVNI
jgi:hypothetical protein